MKGTRALAKIEATIRQPGEFKKALPSASANGINNRYKGFTQNQNHYPAAQRLEKSLPLASANGIIEVQNGFSQNRNHYPPAQQLEKALPLT